MLTPTSVDQTVLDLPTPRDQISTMRKQNAFPVAGLILSLYLWAHFSYGIITQSSAATPFDEILAAAVFPLAIIGVIISFRVLRFSTANVLILFYFLLLIAGSMFFPVATERGMRPLFAGLALEIKPILIMYGFIFLASREADVSRSIRLVTSTLVIIAFVNSIAVIHDLLVGRSLFGASLKLRGPFFQPKGLAFHQVASAQICLMGMIAAGSRLMVRPISKWIPIWLFLWSITLLHISSKEIAVSFAYAATMLLFIFRRRIGARLVIYAMIPIISGWVLFFTPLGEAFLGHVSQYIDEGAAESQVRTALTEASWQIAGDYFPLGTGPGTFASAASKIDGYSSLYKAYNIFGLWGANRENDSFLTDVFWPKVIAEAGFFGAISYFTFIMTIIFICVQNSRTRAGSTEIFCTSVVLSVLLISIAQPALTNGFAGVLFYFCAAFALINLRNTTSSRRSRRRETSRARVEMAALERHL